jgi:DNA invertase Pin-like site-specific DNA recombinase
MSTEHQQYSIDNQSDWNTRYAEAHGMEIVRTFSDVESGVNIRDGLQSLLDEVEGGHAGYSVVLVYDVSRWGRFQDTDESAYYEFRCKRAGVAVHYCAELFENDGGFLSSLLKSIKRSMAGEYSRELSAKVFAGQSRLVRLGFHIVGVSGYGFDVSSLIVIGTRKDCSLPEKGRAFKLTASSLFRVLQARSKS